MDGNTMYWLFTTAPQAIAALVGIIFTGMFFMAESIDNRVKADQSLTEIAETAKTALYKNMKIVSVLAALTILYDLFLVAFVPKLTDEDCCWTGWLIFIFSVLNISTIYSALSYVFQAVSPNYFNKIAANLSSKYKTGEVDSQEFINHFIIFERAARETPDIKQIDRRLSIRDILRILVANQMINPHDADTMTEISKVRNLIVHGEPIEKVDRKLDDELRRITEKVKR
jgi:hypothetical protein